MNGEIGDSHQGRHALIIFEGGTSVSVCVGGGGGGGGIESSCDTQQPQ